MNNRKPKYQKGYHFNEVKRKNFLQRYYLVDQCMNFQTKVLGVEGEIVRADGKLLARLERDGMLYVYPGYFWDGPSSFTYDTIAFVIGSLPHDVIYQMLRECLILDKERFQEFALGLIQMYNRFVILREWADDTMKEVNYENGMSRFRSFYTHWFVRRFGEKNALPPILEAVI